MEEIAKIKQQLESLIDENATKEQIEKIAVINDTLADIENKTSKQKEEYTELLKDYATAIKHQAFTVNNKNIVDEGPKEFTFEGFVSQWQNKK